MFKPPSPTSITSPPPPPISFSPFYGYDSLGQRRLPIGLSTVPSFVNKLKIDISLCKIDLLYSRELFYKKLSQFFLGIKKTSTIRSYRSVGLQTDVTPLSLESFSMLFWWSLFSNEGFTVLRSVFISHL